MRRVPIFLLQLNLVFSLLCSGALSLARAEVLTLSQAIELAQAKSPDLLQLENQTDSAAAKKRLAIAPTEPNLNISFNDMLKPFDISTTSSEVLQLTQPVGFPGRAFLNRSMLSDQEDSLHYQGQALRLQVALNVKLAYYGLQLAQMNMKLNADTRLAYERILSIAKRRYESGQTSQVDYLNAQVQLLQNQNDLTDLMTAEKATRAQLNVLLRNPVPTALEVQPIHMIYHPPVDLEDSISKMLAQRNEIKSVQAQVQASDKAYKLAWMSLLPDFQLTAGMTYYRQPYASPLSSVPMYTTGQTDNGASYGEWPTHTYMVGIQFTVPLWGVFNEREAIVGASHDRAATEAGLDVLYNQSKVALEGAVDAANATETKIENFEKHLLPLAEQSFNLALINYSSGKIDFQTLSDTAGARRTARLNYATAITAYLTNYSTYGQLIGEDL
jgi:outer membrane protein, heavy metal efflux system